MTKPKPLEWYDNGHGGAWPMCSTCVELMLSPLFFESVSSTAIESPLPPEQLLRRVVEQYHAGQHPGGTT